MSLASGGNENSSGVPLPRGLVRESGWGCCHQRTIQPHHSRILHVLACLPLLPSGTTSQVGSGEECGGRHGRWCVNRYRGPPRWGLGHTAPALSHTRPTSSSPTPEPRTATARSVETLTAALVVLWICHLAHDRLTHIQRLLVWKPAPLQPSTAYGRVLLSALHPIEYSLLQPRSAPGDARARGRPSRRCHPPCPFYTMMLCSCIW